MKGTYIETRSNLISRKPELLRPWLSPERIWVYLIWDKDTNYHKIGKAENPDTRLKQLMWQGTKLPRPNDFHLLQAWLMPPLFEIVLHNTFDSLRRNGEWFALTSVDIEQIIYWTDGLERWCEHFPNYFDESSEFDGYPFESVLIALLNLTANTAWTNSRLAGGLIVK